MPYLVRMHHNASNPDQVLMSTAEVAKYLRLDVTTINRYAQSGKLPTAVKTPGIRGARMFQRLEVDRLNKALANDPRTPSEMSV